jgi:hypothetical protein
MSAEFEGTLVKWGTSVGLAIPKPVNKRLRILILSLTKVQGHKRYSYANNDNHGYLLPK